MSDTFKTDDFSMPQVQEISIPKADDASNEISELSKKGYQFLKENKVEDAVNSFKKILEIEENNNYALVGLGDTARKQNSFNEAIKYYSK